MSRTLPSLQTLKDINAEARNLLHDLRRGDVLAARRYYLLDSEAGEFEPRLADAQYIIARKYGFMSWQALQQHLAIATWGLPKLPSGVRLASRGHVLHCRS